jgi:4,5-DOPA dioxygenase extradiol
MSLTRRAMLGGLLATGLRLTTACGKETSMPATRQPVLFVGHGSPEHGVRDTPYSRAFTALGQQLDRPRAVLVISAHWETRARATTADPHPATIHDFGGFPEDFYHVDYPAPGDPALAADVARRVDGTPVTGRGLDHGVWCVLRWVFQEADVPVVQLSLDRTLDAAGHLAMGRRLAALRDEGVLIVGSGNLTHDLRDAFGRLRSGATETPPWAARFDAHVASLLQEGDLDGLVRASSHPDFAHAHPSLEHWWPILYAAGAGEGSTVDFPITGFDAGSLSMRSVRFS